LNVCLLSGYLVDANMKLIDKHLLREFLVPVTYCLLSFLMIVVINELFQDMRRLVDVRPPVHLIVRFYACSLAPSLQYLLPASLMLATLYTLYGLTRSNELVAMRASGVSIYRIMVPFLGVGVVVSLMTGALNELWIPRALEWSAEIKANRFEPVEEKVVDQCIYFNFANSRQWFIGSFDTKHPGRLQNVEVKQETADGLRQSIVSAEAAAYLDGQWWFYGPRIQRFGPNDNPIGEEESLGVKADSVVEMRDYHERPSAFVSTVRPWEFLNVWEMHHYLKTHQHLSPRALAEKRYSLHSHLAMPWACLIVILFAIPAGARTGRQGMLSAVFTAMGLMASFYALAQVGLVLGSTGAIPSWAGAWLSNAVFLVVGLVQLSRIR
jgi:lipopolysaccharide export system permease protein